MKTILLIISLFMATLQSCTSDENTEYQPTLPPITQTGENTFGCYVDGNLLVPRSGCSGGYLGGGTSAMSIGGSSSNINYNEIHVRDCKTSTAGIMYITFIKIYDNGVGLFDIENGNCIDSPNDLINVKIKCRMNNKWYCSMENTGTVSITKYDYNNGYIAGVFNCKAVNRDDSTDIIEITEGRFDIKVMTLSDTTFP